MTIRRTLRKILPESVANTARRMEETKALAAVPVQKCDAGSLTRQEPAIPSLPDWDKVEQQVGFGPERAQAVNAGDQRLIYTLARAVAPRSVLEIGTNVGGSTAMFSMALGKNGRMTTVDIVDVNGPEGPAQKIGFETPAAMVERLGFNNVTFVTSSSTDFLRRCKDRYDLIFLDGAHEAEVVYQEVPLALSLLNPNGVILLHDYFPDLKPLWSNGKVIPGPYLAIERLKKEGAPLRVKPFGALPWPTKLGSNVTSLALLLHA